MHALQLKLDHGLMHIDDLVHEEELFANLLECLNSDDSSSHRDVLQLLDKFVQVSSWTRLTSRSRPAPRVLQSA